MNQLKKVVTNKKVFKLFVVTLFLIYAILMTVFLGSACPLYLIFGVPCPSCGITRAHLLFFALDFRGAFAMHPLFFFTLPIGIFLVVDFFKPQSFKAKKWTVVMIVMSVALIVCYVVRMILYFPHTSPMSYNDNSLLEFIIRLLKKL